VTVEEAQDFLLEHVFRKGSHCPCCGQFVKIHKRQISDSMAIGLIVLYHEQRRVGKEAWIKITDLFKEHKVCSDNMGALLRFWGLIERQPGVRDDGSWRVGFYRMTDLGRAFVEGKCTVLKYIYQYNQTLIDMGKDADLTEVSIHEALKAKFNYAELMR
jgi:hypothetical protein